MSFFSSFYQCDAHPTDLTWISAPLGHVCRYRLQKNASWLLTRRCKFAMHTKKDITASAQKLVYTHELHESYITILDLTATYVRAHVRVMYVRVCMTAWSRQVSLSISYISMFIYVCMYTHVWACVIGMHTKAVISQAERSFFTVVVNLIAKLLSHTYRPMDHHYHHHHHHHH